MRILSCAACLVGICNVWAGEWIHSGNADLNFHAPGITNVENFDMLWWHEPWNGIYSESLSPPVIAEGQVFLLQSSNLETAGDVHAYDLRTGKINWHVNLSGGLHDKSSITYHQGQVFIHAGGESYRTGKADQAMHALDAQTGAENWVTKHVGNSTTATAAPTAYDGKVYAVSDYSGKLHAYDAVTGEIEWTSQWPQKPGFSPAVRGDVAYVYLGADSESIPSPSAGPETGRLYAIDRHTGDILYEIEDPNTTHQRHHGPGQTMLGSNNNAIVYDVYSHRVISFDLANQTVGWELNAQSLALANGVVYASTGSTLLALDELTGSTLWSWELEKGILSSNLVVSDSHVFLSNGSEIFAVDIDLHKAVWSYGRYDEDIQQIQYLAMADGVLIATRGYSGLTEIMAFGDPTATAVPEPSSVLIFSVAIGGVWWYQRRRNRKG